MNPFISTSVHTEGPASIDEVERMIDKPGSQMRSTEYSSVGAVGIEVLSDTQCGLD